MDSRGLPLSWSIDAIRPPSLITHTRTLTTAHTPYTLARTRMHRLTPMHTLHKLAMMSTNTWDYTCMLTHTNIHTLHWDLNKNVTSCIITCKHDLVMWLDDPIMHRTQNDMISCRSEVLVQHEAFTALYRDKASCVPTPHPTLVELCGKHCRYWELQEYGFQWAGDEKAGWRYRLIWGNGMVWRGFTRKVRFGWFVFSRFTSQTEFNNRVSL